ncbi:hypothetical protein M8J76_007796 [Diaphorina citri]|nr:hypothetical protein M8J76_007796 [Diaphorina citri]
MGDATGGGDGDPPDLMSMQTQMDTGTPDTGTVLEKQRAPLLYNAEMKFDWYKLIIQSKSTVGSNASNGNYIRALHLSRVLSETTSKSGDITEIRRLNRNKFLVVCRTAKCANEIIENKKDFPPLKPNKNTTQARTIEKYVPPPLASRTTKRKTVLNPSDVTSHHFNEKRKPVPPHFNAAQAISKPESYYTDKEISKMFYKGCEANKMEKQAFSFSNASQTPQSSSMFPSQDSPAVNIPSSSNFYSDTSLRNNKDVVFFKECQRTMSPHMG